MIIIVKITNKVLVLKLKFEEEKTLGINIKIIMDLLFHQINIEEHLTVKYQ